MTAALLRRTFGFAGLVLVAGAHADDADRVQYKLSTGLHRFSGGGVPGGSALDLNLRASAPRWGDVWVAWYRAPLLDLTQSRIGWDNTFRFGAWRVSPSLQFATGGFAGASVGVETGESAFVGAGLGRTNLRDYFNLNFDPNDAWSLGAGYRWHDARSLALQVVRDNRAHPDQRHVHLVYRQPLPDGRRLIVDLLHKRGDVDAERIRRFGITLGYDHRDLGIRIAYDPKLNFSTQDMLRLTLSKRF